MAQLTLQIDSPSLLEQLKNVLSLMRGVKIVSDSPVSRSAALEDVPNAETLAAMKEAESGHDAGVVRVDSLESFRFFCISHVKIQEKWFILVHFTKSLFLFFFVAYRTATILALASTSSPSSPPITASR